MSSLCFSYEWWRHGIWSIYIPSLVQLTSDSSVVYNQEMYMSPLSPLFDGNKRKRRAKELYTILVLSRHNYLRACLPSGISWVEISHWSETTALDAFCSLRQRDTAFSKGEGHMLNMRQLRCMVSGQRMWWWRIFRLASEEWIFTELRGHKLLLD